MDRQAMAIRKLREAHQEHVLRFWDELTGDERDALARQVMGIDFSVLEAAQEGPAASDSGTVRPLPALELGEVEREKDRFEAAGLKALQEGRVCAVLLAGGMGTRLGSSAPKGMFDLGKTRHVFIFQRAFEVLLAVCGRIGRPIRFFIMTSELNDKATRAFIEEQNYFGYDPAYVTFFTQDMAPAVDFAGHVLMESKGRIATAPNGNGGWLTSLARAGLLDVMHREGIEWINVFGVDNVLARICDPVFVGATLLSGCATSVKVVRKAFPEEKMGVMCLKDGRPAVIEYTELTDDLRNEKNDKGEPAYNFGVTVNYLFHLGEAEKVMNGNFALHLARKKIPCIDAAGCPVTPDEPNGIKFELFIFDLLSQMPGCLPVEVVREQEFAPVKNRTGVDSVESARRLLELNGISL